MHRRRIIKHIICEKINIFQEITMEIDAAKNFWVVRAGKGGEFYQHFMNNNLVAIGHWDIAFPESQRATPCIAKLADESYVQRRIFNKHQFNSQKTASTEYTQGLRFINEAKVGDIVITMTGEQICLGEIISEAYLEDTLIYDHISDTRFSYKLRREVKWSAPQSKKDLPYVIQRSLRGSLTFFSMGKHKIELYHWMNSFFHDEENCYISININQDEDISNIYVSEFQLTLSKIEAISRIVLDDIELPVDNIEEFFEERFKELKQCDELFLTTKQEFMSKGIIWGKLSKKSSIHAAIFSFCLSTMLSSEISANDNNQLSSIQKENIQILARVVKKTNDVDNSIKKLKINTKNKNIDNKSQEELDFSSTPSEDIPI